VLPSEAFLSKSRRKTLLALVPIAIIGALGWAYRRASADSEQKKAASEGLARARVVSVEFARARVGRISEKLTLTGALKPKEQVDVMPKATGRLQAISVYVGDRVRQGQQIAILEDDEIEQQVRRAQAVLSVARAGLAQREAELRNAKAELNRAESLQEGGLISAQDYATRRTNYDVVQAQVELARAEQQQADAELRELSIQLGQTRIYSPLTGEVAIRHVDRGAMVSPTTPIVRVVNLRTMITAASVPERDVGKLRVGNHADIRVDAFGDQEFRGRVARIAPVLDPATRSATIEIEIPNEGGRLKAEMFARVELDLASTREAVLIPREALIYRGTQPGVFIVQGNTPVFKPVEAGLTDGDQVEILAGVSPGTVLAGRGAGMIREGDRVAPVDGERAGGQS
jgi:HlyD family secretion protein